MKRFLSLALLLLATAPLWGQALSAYEQLIYPEKQRSILTYIADDQTTGRASGTEGKMKVEQFIIDHFKRYGLKPYNWSYTQSFLYNDSIPLRNVVGCIPARGKSDEYIIISAHYDHIGELAGKIYNGADDNASGVTALINLAEMFGYMKSAEKGPRKNLIFVAFDGKELSMSGSEYFVKHLNIPKGKIICNINIDMIGTSLVPPHSDKEFVIVLGEESLPEKHRGILASLCRKPQYRMDLDLTFYGSKEFTKMIYSLGDQNSFTKAKIPALLFTSAFHQYTYKPTDDPDIIDYPLLRKRTYLIFNFINKL